MGVLAEQTIKKRLDDDIVISPILNRDSQIKGASVNLRLGTRFIVTKKTELAVLDPAELKPTNIDKFQTKYDLSFGQIFMLHPRHLVLACTFEFIKLPSDICAQVLTRSKYGRLGLIVATAVYVHPGWRGCLTLELINYGDVPIPLRCGSSIAHIVLLTTQKEPKRKKPVREAKSLLYIPTGPLFADMSTEEPDWFIFKATEKANQYTFTQHPEDLPES